MTEMFRGSQAERPQSCVAEDAWPLVSFDGSGPYAGLFDADDVSVSDAVNAQILDRVGSAAWSAGSI